MMDGFTGKISSDKERDKGKDRQEVAHMFYQIQVFKSSHELMR